MNTPTQRLVGLGMVNTFTELREAHFTIQYTTLSKATSGCRLLARLHIHHPTLSKERVRIPEVWRYALHVRLIPANMTCDDHSGRRIARAVALTRHYGTIPATFYVDASGPHHGGWYTAKVVHKNVALNGLTFIAQDITHDDKIAIALAAAYQDSRVKITDFRGACRNIELGHILLFAYRNP